MVVVLITEVDMMLGLGIAFGLAFTLTYLTYKDIETFFSFLTIFIGFCVWSALLPLWSLVLCLIFMVFIIANNIQKKRVG